MSKVMLIGSDYFPYRGSGDKNFWLELVTLVENELEEIVILSINNWDQKMVIQNPRITIYNIPPIKIKGNDGIGRKCHRDFHKNYFEKSLTFIRILKKIKKIARNHKIDVVHFMDIYGPTMFFTKRKVQDARLTVSMASYQNRNYFYNAMLKLSLHNVDKVITYSEALKEKLNSLGLQDNNITTIRWGVDTLKLNRDEVEKKETKKIFDVDERSRVILWSGYLQQSSYEDFIYSLKIARKVTKNIKNCIFLFAFKPEHFKSEYMMHKGKKIKIETNVDIYKILNITDILLSPISSKNSIIAPPLLWLEAMAYGIPIVTTEVGGVRECIIDNVTGHIGNINALDKNIIDTLNDDNKLVTMSRSTIQLVEKKYNIENAVKRYLSVWSE